MLGNQEACPDEVAIRTIRESDAEAFLELCRAIDQESDFMLYVAGERALSVDDQRARIRAMLDTGRQTVFLCTTPEDEGGERLVGYLLVLGGTLRRVAHTAYLVMGIREAYTGRGLGTRLFAHLEQWARERGIVRLELGVMAHNARAVALYRKVGLQLEGTKRGAYRVGDALVDEHLMAKLLATPYEGER